MGSGNLTKFRGGGEGNWWGCGSGEMDNSACLSASLHPGVGMGISGLSDLICSELTFH